MSKTIKQIADELGVSKTAVRKKIENLGVFEKLQTNGNRILIDDKQERLIKSAFSKNKIETRKPKEVSENRLLLDLVSTLQKELEVKNEQLKEKDVQLAEKDKQIENAQKLADQAQQLQAIAEQKLQLLENKTSIEEETETPKQSWWAKLWNR